MSWHFSRELVEGCMAASCLDGVAAVQWKLMPMPDMCSSHVRMMELFPFSRFGMMCVHLTVELGEALLTWFLAGFRARMCLSRDREEGLSTASEVVCGGSMPESLPRCGRDMSLPKTARCWSVEDCISCCGTLPDSGMMRRGVCYRREIAERRTCGKGCGCLLPPPSYSQSIPYADCNGWEAESAAGATFVDALAGASGEQSCGAGGFASGGVVRVGSPWVPQPLICRMADGVAYREHRIRCAGNGQVPIVAASAFRFLRKVLEDG